jgi:hypothetical protein
MFVNEMPEIAKEWHPQNGRETSEVKTGSNFRAKWICSKCCQVWETYVSNRCKNGSGCPFCRGRGSSKKVVLMNSLQTEFPDIAAEWHNSNEILPHEISSGSSRKSNWCCKECGHVWIATPNNRCSGSGCPKCSQQKRVNETNSVADKFPEIVKEWHNDNEFPPNKVAIWSHQKIKWKCSVCRKIWISRVGNRLRVLHNAHRGCPKCKLKFGNGKLSKEDVVKVRLLIDAGKSDYDISLIFFVSPQNISAIRHNKIWKT